VVLLGAIGGSVVVGPAPSTIARGLIVVAFLLLQAQVDGLLLEVGNPLVEGVDIGPRTEPGLAPGGCSCRSWSRL
jgi:hypothetical protein